MASLKARRVVLTGAVTAITATGAWYGSQLKTHQEARQEAKAVREATTEEQIAMLEAQRVRLVTKRRDLQKKIDQLHAKREAHGEDNG